MCKNKPSAELLFQIKVAGLPDPLTEFMFHPTRKWRLDICWTKWKFAIEVEGGTWIGGRHVRGIGFENDCIKYAEAIKGGWTILRVTSKMVSNGQALYYADQILRDRMLGDQYDI